MSFRIKTPHSARVLGVSLAAVTVAVPALLAALMPGRADALVPLAIMLPFLSMGALDAALPDEHARHT